MNAIVNTLNAANAKKDAPKKEAKTDSFALPKNAPKGFKTLIDALTQRGKTETMRVRSKLNAHVIAYAQNVGLDINEFSKCILITDEKAPGFVAQKAVERALLLVQGCASGTLSTIPPTVIQIIAGIQRDAGKSEPNLYAQGLLSRFIEQEDLSELLTRKGIKHNERGTKAVSTAAAQASSMKSALRGLGVGNGVKHARQYGDLDVSHALIQDFNKLLAK